MKRTETLINKELDGDLSHSEAVELDRAEWTNPDLRRTRHGWQRTKRALESLGPEQPRVPVDRWAAAVSKEVRPRTPFRQQVISVLRGIPWRQRVTMGACGVLTAGAVLFVMWPSAPTPGPATARLRPIPPPAPVEVTIDRYLTDERDDAPVSIRF